jgi:hypothetical protein
LFDQAIDAPFRGSRLDRDVLSLDIAELAETLAEAVESTLRRLEDEPPDRRYIRRLLRASGAGPRDGGAAKQRDEIAPPHAITSSARASSAKSANGLRGIARASSSAARERANV